MRNFNSNKRRGWISHHASPQQNQGISRKDKWWILNQAKGKIFINIQPKVVGDSHHAIHQIYAEEMENGDDVNDDDQMGD